MTEDEEGETRVAQPERASVESTTRNEVGKAVSGVALEMGSVECLSEKRLKHSSEMCCLRQSET
jgi:hypothetical protein